MAEAALEWSEPVDLSKHPSGIVPTLQNIVSTVNLDCKLDLKAIALQVHNAEYNPKGVVITMVVTAYLATTAPEKRHGILKARYGELKAMAYLAEEERRKKDEQ